MATPMSVEHLDLFYGDFQALHDISVNMPAGKITAFIGPSGCGKSTLLRCLDRMNDRVQGCKVTGTVKLGETDVYKDIDVYELRRRVGMVFQKPNPFPMSVYDNIAFGLKTHGVKSKAMLDDIVERSLKGAAIWDELKDRLKKPALGLSGGQQQRLCIARALAVEPEVLLMDAYGIIGLNSKGSANKGFLKLSPILFSPQMRLMINLRRKHAQNEDLSAKRSAACNSGSTVSDVVPSRLLQRQSAEHTPDVDLHRSTVRYPKDVSLACAA